MTIVLRPFVRHHAMHAPGFLISFGARQQLGYMNVMAADDTSVVLAL
jgi:hypothetical protein